MNAKKILAVGLGIVLVAEAVYVWCAFGKKENNAAKPSTPVTTSPQAKPAEHSYLQPKPNQVKQTERKTPDAKWQKMRELKRKIAENPKQPEVLLALAEFYQGDGVFEAMQLYAERAVTACGDNGEILWAVAKLYEMEMEYDAALKHLHNAKQMKPSDIRSQELDQKIHAVRK